MIGILLAIADGQWTNKNREDLERYKFILDMKTERSDSHHRKFWQTFTHISSTAKQLRRCTEEIIEAYFTKINTSLPQINSDRLPSEAVELLSKTYRALETMARAIERVEKELPVIIDLPPPKFHSEYL